MVILPFFLNFRVVNQSHFSQQAPVSICTYLLSSFVDSPKLWKMFIVVVVKSEALRCLCHPYLAPHHQTIRKPSPSLPGQNTLSTAPGLALYSLICGFLSVFFLVKTKIFSANRFFGDVVSVMFELAFYES